MSLAEKRERHERERNERQERERTERAERNEPEPEARGERGLEGFARRAVEAGVNRMLSTEDGLRAVVDAVLPRELVGRALDQVDAAKSEAVAVVGREMRTFLANLNVGEEIAKILTSVSFEVKMQVRFVPNEDGTLRASVRSDGPQVQVQGNEKMSRRATREAAQAAAQAAASGVAPTATAATSPAGTAAATPAVDKAAAAAEAKLAAAASAGLDSIETHGDDADNRPAARHRRTISDVVGRIAGATAAATRVAAEVAADAAAEVVNRSIAAGERDRDRDDDDYNGSIDGY